eukprot:CAMPEP_0117693100 /NCGR_PEP_ID=MMETSP0804-20121206/26688_1 /TAXON_ID=1074897 /ORGANISM="Tetraselmis astigmatica, Strain CCMP880" /LENGTH=391 /DNA_ID=CAMNT_0005506607 /DNA_START=131 /DNA_END=1306 /DNA_ORIENTATION=+
MSSGGGNNSDTPPEVWCDALKQPCLFPAGLAVLSQPSSTYICLALVLLYFIFGCMLFAEARYGQQEVTPTTRDPLKRRLVASFAPLSYCRCFGVASDSPSRRLPVGWKDIHKSRLCYAWSLMWFGVAVTSACVSYQTFTWQLNCRGRDAPCVGPEGDPLYAADTNPAALVYLILQVASYHLLVVGDAYRALRLYVKPVAIYSVLVTVFYACWCFTVQLHGHDNLFMASLWVSIPPVVGSVILNAIVHYEWRLVVAWGVLIVSFLGYIVWDALIDESQLWQDTGVWMHANDILHILLLPYPPTLWWAGGLAEDAPEGTAGITDDQADGDVDLPSPHMCASCYNSIQVLPPALVRAFQNSNNGSPEAQARVEVSIPASPVANAESETQPAAHV